MEQKHSNELDTFHPIGLAANRVVLNLIKLRKFSEMFDGTAVVSNRSLQGSLECTKINAAPVLGEPGYKPITLVSVNALEAGGGSEKPLIGAVLPAASLSQIVEGVVISPAVDVVDKAIRPFASYIKPRNARSAMQNAVNANYRVALQLADTASALANEAGRKTIPPSEHARQRIIIKRLLQTLKGESFVHLVRHLDKHHVDHHQSENDHDGRKDNSPKKKEATKLVMVR